jgi:hypothetical protein
VCCNDKWFDGCFVLEINNNNNNNNNNNSGNKPDKGKEASFDTARAA